MCACVHTQTCTYSEDIVAEILCEMSFEGFQGSLCSLRELTLLANFITALVRHWHCHYCVLRKTFSWLWHFQSMLLTMQKSSHLDDAIRHCSHATSQLTGQLPNHLVNRDGTVRRAESCKMKVVQKEVIWSFPKPLMNCEWQTDPLLFPYRKTLHLW